MPEAPSLTIQLPGYPVSNLSSATTLAALRALASASFVDGQDIMVDGGTSAGDGLGGMFTWSAASTATDNGATVIKPDDKTGLQAGRWVGGSGFVQAGTGAVARSLAGKLGDVVSVKDFGARGDGATNDTVAIQAAIDALLADKGGTLYFPPGTYMVSALTLTETSYKTIIFKGAGKKSSAIAKIAGTSTPILTFNGAAVQDTYHGFEDIALLGSLKANSGIVTTVAARFFLNRFLVQDCNIGLDMQGALIFQANDCSINGNNIGLKVRKSGSIYGNLFSVVGGEMRNNTSFAMDLGEGMGSEFRSVDFENNGTAANTGTGAVIIRATTDDESALATFAFNSCWFESNLGKTFVAEASQNTNVKLDSCVFFTSESSRDVDVGSIRNFTATNCIASGTFTIAAACSQLIGSHIATVADTSGSRFHLNVVNSGATLYEGAGVGAVGWNKNTLGFYGATPAAKPAVSGSRGGNAALASLLTALGTLGLITDSSSA